MKSKIHLLTIVAMTTILCCLNDLTFAQRAINLQVAVSYTRLPMNPLNKELKTYQAKIIQGDLEIPNKTALNDQFLVLRGYEKVKENADIIIEVKFNSFEIVKRDDGQRTITNKDKTKTTKYFYTVEYTFPVSYKIMTKDGEEISAKELHSYNERLTAEFGMFISKNQLQNEYEENKGKFIRDTRKAAIQHEMAGIKMLLDNNYAYLDMTKKFGVYTGKAKKQNYDDLNAAQKDAMRAYSLMNANSDWGEIETLLKSAIVVWEKAFLESDLNNRKARINPKISGYVAFNLAYAYLWLNDFSNAKRYAAEVSINKKTSSTGKSQQLFITDQSARFDANK
ncbi:MAG: hypothetical protein JKY33_01630 [Bacteroidia bacterium]|nr:hypothetical protein [Bacteroidia bacterium]